MPHPQLTNGAITDIMNGVNVNKPILQVLGNKKIAGNPGASNDRYRLLVSDGVHSHSSAMLATQLNHMVQNDELLQFTVIELAKYLVNQIGTDRRVMIMLEINVITPGPAIGVKIGNPQSFGGKKEGGGPSNDVKPVLQQKQQPPLVNGGGPKTPDQNKFGGGKSFYGNNAAQSRNFGGARAGGDAAAASKAPNTPGGTPARVYPIESLTPYQNKWTIKARVTQKSAIKTWSNSRGDGKLFSFNLLDESAEIRATAFNTECDQFHDFIEVNKVYYLSRARLKTANKQYSSVNNEYEMTLSSDTQITLCDTEEEGNLPSVKFDFVPIDQLTSHQPNTTIDVLGVVHSMADVSTITSKNTNKQITKRDLQLVDKSGVQVRMTLWGDEAQQFQGEKQVLAVKGAKISEWNGRSLSSVGGSMILLNPDLPDASALKGWYDSEGRDMQFDEFNRADGGGGGGGGSGTNWKTLKEAKETLGKGDKADYFTTKATAIFCKKENCMYQACPSEQCNKKVIDNGNGTYRCEKCDKEYPNFKYRMILSVNLADHTEQQWVTFFQDSGQQILGVPTDQLGEWKDMQDPRFDDAFSDAQFKTGVFRLRSKMETYNDEEKMKTVCVEVKDVDFKQHSARLIADIESMLAA